LKIKKIEFKDLEIFRAAEFKSEVQNSKFKVDSIWQID